MDPSPVALALFSTFLLGFTHTTRADQVDYCKGVCPEFTRGSTNGTYEVRHYHQTVWMCTFVTDTSDTEVLDAASRITDFRKAVNIDANTWPVQFSVKEVQGKEKYELCYFIPPMDDIPIGRDKVTVETLPPATMFVRVFDGSPSFAKAEEKAQQLKDDLTDAGEKFNPKLYYGAGYESYFSLWHHNEIWFIKDSS